ncbi:hypothetical protein Ocin01_16687 [Orchesella cincta]|uniref:Uncharacterized protein n=1 Tax=Orchesella cincta TaxID=48709 RepID=A0A1D2MAH5_ORCCI|nr:hypothetical protein Ocin01_16687 [Orchesella cincta]
MIASCLSSNPTAKMLSTLRIFYSFFISILLPIATTASYFESSGCVGQKLFNLQGSILYNSTFRNPQFGNTGKERCVWVLAAGQATYNLEYHVESVYGQDSALTGTCISSTGGNNITLSNFQMNGSQNLSVSCPVLIITYHTEMSSVVSSKSGFSLSWSTEGGAAENYSPQSSHYTRIVTSDLIHVRKSYENNELSTFIFVRDPRDLYSQMIVTYSPKDGHIEEADGLEGDCYDHLLVYRFEPLEGYVAFTDDQDLNQICVGMSDFYPSDEITLFVFRSDDSVF